MGGAELVSAALTFTPVTWGSGGDTLGWFSTNVVGGGVGSGATSPATGGNPASSGYLSLHFEPPTPIPTGPVHGEMVTMGAAYTGDYTAEHFAGAEPLFVQFDFLGFPVGTQFLYFESSAGGGSSWAYELTGVEDTWVTQAIPFGTDAGWTQLSGADPFALALTDVSLIGIQVDYLIDGEPLDFGIDNWHFLIAVPEPGEIALAITMLLCVGLTMRGRLVDMFRRKAGEDEAVSEQPA